MEGSLQRDIAWLDARLEEVVPAAADPELASLRALVGAMLASGGVDPALRRLDLERIRAILKRLAIRFHLRNKAEQIHIARVNRRRERGSRPGHPRPESLQEAVEALAARGCPLPRLREILDRLDVAPTLTAHPTESRRRSVLEKQRRIGDALEELDRGDPTDAERARAASEVRQSLSLLLATDEVRARRLDVIDEVRNGVQSLAGVIWDAIPSLARDLVGAVEASYGERLDPPVLVRYRSWIGGDRDGNPNVTARHTREALAEMRGAAIERHAIALERLRRELSLSDRRVPIAPELLESIARDEAERPLDPALIRHLRHEPLRIKIRHIQARLGREDYPASRFVEDLEILQRAVAHAGLHEVASRGPLADAILRARTFGFHLAALDIRQHSRIHEAAVAELLRAGGVHDRYDELDEAARHALLRHELRTSRPLLGPGVGVSEQSRELLDTLAVVAEAIRRQPESIGSWIVSMARDPSDLLEVLLLLREVGLWRIDDGVVASPIDVTPLFETVDDLAGAASVLRQLFADPVYGAHLAARGRFQEIMMGYSDSNKDGGYLAANRRLAVAQDELARACTDAGIGFRFFHGRGGTVARGGGRAHRAILATPAAGRNGRIRFTEQGEVISFRYATPALAHRHLEQILNAVIQATAHTGEDVQPDPRLDALGEALAARSRIEYRALIDDPAFWPWFAERSPVQHIGELPIASRPVSRSGGALRFENLRAIPWVFAWTQMRYGVPGWYGLGTAFEEIVLHDPAELGRCRAAYRDDGQFRAVIDNAQQEMARARLEVARWYSDGGPDALHERIAQEFRRAEQAVLRVTGQEGLLDNNPVIQRSIRERNPDTDLINALQVELLRRWRERDADDPDLRTTILLSVNALAAAMQSTG